MRYGARNISHTRPTGLGVSTPRGSFLAYHPPQGGMTDSNRDEGASRKPDLWT